MSSVIYSVISQVMGWAIVDGKKVPYSVYQKIDPLVQDIKRWSPILEHLDLTDPLTIPSALSSVASNLVESPPIKKDPIKSYLRANGSSFECPTCLTWIGEFLMQDRELKEVIKSGSMCLAEMKLEEELSIFFLINEEEEGEPFKEMYVSSDAEIRDRIYEIMAREFWQGHSTIIMDKERDEYQIKEYRSKGEEREYQGEMNEFIDGLQGFIDKKIRRVVVLQGIPGTGKSTLCLNARRLSSRTIIISNKFVQNVTKEEWEMVINVLLPEMVIIDDIDRVPQRSLETALHLFEDDTYRVPITLLTTNDYAKLPDAFLRPGRIDQIMSMPKPSRDIKGDILREFIKNLEIPDGYLTDNNRAALMKMMEDETISGAYVKELLKRFWVYGNSYEIPDNDEQFKKLVK